MSLKHFGIGKDIFVQFIKDSNITTKDNTANAIWSVGKNDGVYLGILNSDGTIRDINFFVNGQKQSLRIRDLFSLII